MVLGYFLASHLCYHLMEFRNKFFMLSVEIDPQLELEAVVNSIQNKHASVSAKKLLKKNKKLQELNDKK